MNSCDLSQYAESHNGPNNHAEDLLLLISPLCREAGGLGNQKAGRRQQLVSQGPWNQEKCGISLPPLAVFLTTATNSLNSRGPFPADHVRASLSISVRVSTFH